MFQVSKATVFNFLEAWPTPTQTILCNCLGLEWGGFVWFANVTHDVVALLWSKGAWEAKRNTYPLVTEHFTEVLRQLRECWPSLRGHLPTIQHEDVPRIHIQLKQLALLFDKIQKITVKTELELSLQILNRNKDTSSKCSAIQCLLHDLVSWKGQKLKSTKEIASMPVQHFKNIRPCYSEWSRMIILDDVLVDFLAGLDLYCQDLRPIFSQYGPRNRLLRYTFYTL